MDRKQLESRLEEIEDERKWLRRAIKVIEDGEKFQTKQESGGQAVPSPTTGSISQKRV